MSKRKGDPGYPAGWCIHYRSSHGGETFTDCEAGIPFAVWNAVKFDTRPCFLGKDGESKPGRRPHWNARRCHERHQAMARRP